MKQSLISSSPTRTYALGKRIGADIPAGTVIALIGDLGGGKTLFTRGLADGLGVPEKVVNSPTFVLVNEYKGRMPIFHMDLYRLSSVAEGMEIGLMDYLRRGKSGIIVVEWAEKLEHLLSPDWLEIHFEVTGPRQRRLILATENKELGKIVREAVKA